MPEPKHNRGNSKQDYRTPPELLKAVKQRLQIEEFAIDLAASEENRVAPAFYSEPNSALLPQNTWHSVGWAWCNPPFKDIEPWVFKAAKESMNNGAQIVMLTPVSFSNWWLDCVDNHAYVCYLNGRIKFVGAEQGYPKDCALLFYTPWGFIGSEIWSWR